VGHDHAEMSRHLEGVRYQWTFPDGFQGVASGSDPSRAGGTFEDSGANTVNVTITDARGNASTVTQTLTLSDPLPYTVTLTATPSNPYNRTPIQEAFRVGVTGGHPNDRVTGFDWTLDGAPLVALKNHTGGVVEITDPGAHTVAVTVTSRMGKTATGSLGLSLTADQPPSCSITTKASPGGVSAVADCADPDGRVVGYAWTIDGRTVPGSTDRVLLTPVKGGRTTSTVSVVATDDGRVSSAPVSVSVSY